MALAKWNREALKARFICLPERSAALAALALLLFVLASSGCPSSRPVPAFSSASGAGVRLSRLRPADVPLGPRVQAHSGDYLLESQHVRVVVAAAASLRDGGSLVDATVGSFVDDQLGGLVPVLELDGALTPLVVVQVAPELSRERPELKVVHETADHSLRLTTRVRLHATEASVILDTELVNAGQRSVRVRLGDRVRWHVGVPFAPGQGFVERELDAVVPWLARPGRRQSYALVFPDAPVEARFRESLSRRDEQLVMSGQRKLAPAASARYSRTLLVSRAPFEALAERAWHFVGTATGWIEGHLDPPPAWALVEARDGRGNVVMSVESQQGRFRMPVPPGRYGVTLTTAGGRDERSAEVQQRRASGVQFIVPQPARLSFLVTDESEQPLPARLVLRGIPPTADPNLGPVHSAAGAANVVCSADGRGAVELPPGRYDVVVTHGPEFTLFESSVEVSNARGATLRAKLDRVVDTAGWVAADFHLHADPSGDSDVSLPDRVTTLLAEGIELAVATDHNHVTDYAPAVRALAATERVSTVTGIEITTPAWGHFNAFPYPPSAPLPPHADGTPRVLFEHVHNVAPGAVVQVNHPRMDEIGYFDVGDLDLVTLRARDGFSLQFDSLEVWNGFDLNRPSVLESVFFQWQQLVARGRPFVAVGNSDSHRVAQQWAGYPRTYVQVGDDRVDATLADRVMAGLKAGRVVVSSGPFVDFRLDGQGPGALVRPAGAGVEVSLDVRAPPWIDLASAEVYVNGKPVRHVEAKAPESSALQVGPGRLFWKGTLQIEADAFVVAVARSASSLSRVLPGTDARSGAFTNPIFVDADGDGTWSAPMSAPAAASSTSAVSAEAGPPAAP